MKTFDRSASLRVSAQANARERALASCAREAESELRRSACVCVGVCVGGLWVGGWVGMWVWGGWWGGV